MKRSAALLAGALTLAASWLSPLPILAKASFTGHMTLHMAVVAVAAPLLALGIAGSRFDPVRRSPALFPAVPLSGLELAVVWAWHAPALHHAARAGAGAFAAEQASFLASSLLVWLAAFGGGAGLREDRALGGVTALLLTSMHMTLLGALLALTPRALYGHHGTALARSPLDDQQLGGAVMLLIGGVSYLAGGLWLTGILLRARREARG